MLRCVKMLQSQKFAKCASDLSVNNEICKMCILSHPHINLLNIWTKQKFPNVAKRTPKNLPNVHLVRGCHSNKPAGWNMNVPAHRLRSPCLPNRLLFVILPGKGDSDLAPVLKRANWIMHHAGEVFARWNDIRRYFYIHPDNRDLHVSYMIRQRASYGISIVTGSKSIMWPPGLMSRQRVWHQCMRHQWQPLPGFAF